MEAAPTALQVQRAAVIDIGSSAIRMEIAQRNASGAIEILESLQRAVPLGRDCFAKNRLETRTINLAVEVLRGFQRILQPYDVKAIRTVATSAVREAGNQELFVERIFMSTGLSVEVLTGAEEDRLLYAAVSEAFRADGLSAEDALIVEQGAGSLELAAIRGGEVVASGSRPLGTLRLASAVGADGKSPAESLDLMRRFVGAALDNVEHTYPLAETPALVILGADARFAAEQLLGHGDQRRIRPIGRAEFLRFATSIGKKRPAELSQRYGLPFEDCQSVGPALLTYAELLKRTPAQTVLVAMASMRDGLLLDLMSERSVARQKELDAQTYASAENLGRRYQFDEAHAHRVADLACALFDALGAEHGLSRRERRLLRVGALLHDVGLFISSNSHHKHGEYIVNASEIFGVRASDKSVVGCLVRYHRRALPQATHASYSALTREDRAVVSKLAALLRVADALDRGHSQAVQLVTAQLGPEELVIKVAGEGDLALERLAVRAKGDLFEEVFGRKVSLQRAQLSQAEPLP